MSSFIQHQTKELADYSNGREWGVGGGGGQRAGTLYCKLRKTTIGLRINYLLINFLEFTVSNKEAEIP